jgi:hypothetical protein
MSFYEESSIVITPNAYKAGTLYAINPASGLADMDVTRATAATRVDESGLVNYAEVIEDSILTGNNSTFDTGIGSWVTYNGGTLAHSTDKLEVTLTSGESGARINTNSLISGGQSGKTFKVRARIWKGTSTNSTISIFIGGAQKFITISPTPTYFEAELTATNTSMLTIYRAGGGGGVGTYFIDDVTVKQVDRDNVPRIDYTGGGCPHILAEPQRDNLIPYSEDFTEWSSKTNIDVTLNSATSPDGVVNATFINENNSNAQHFVGQSLSITNGQDISISVYAKKNQRDVLQISPSGNYLSTSGYANYDLSNGLVTASGGGVTAEIEGLTNGWFRCVAKFTANNTASGTAAFFLQNSTTASRGSSYDGDGTSGIYIWGAQIEVGSYPTSYIPTSGTAVTRNQDQFSRDGISSLINSTEGCVFGEGNFAESNSSSYNYFVSLSDGTSSNRLEVRQSSPNLQFLWRVATYQSEISTSSLDVSSNFKFALNYSAANIKFYVNGDLIGTINTPTLWSVNTLNRLAFDDGTGGNRLSGKVKQLQVYPTALTDEQLIELTGVTYSSYLAMANALNYTIQ